MTHEVTVKSLFGAQNTAGESASEVPALDALIEAEATRLRALAWRFGIPDAELDDAVQEVFIRAWAAHTRFRGDAAVQTWLTRIAVNYFSSRRRTLTRRFHLQRLLTAPPNAAPSTGSPETSEAYHAARACVARLPVRLRKAFVLRHLEEMSVAEVAEILGIGENTVRSRCFNARKRLQVLLREAGFDGAT